MKPAPIPDNDAERLAKLSEYDLLDTPAEAAFDALTTLAAEILSTPIALVSIVDSDRQWFKSRYGLDAPQTPRDVSLCGHVVATGSPLIVNDTHTDPRFSDNPLVTGAPHVRFYAGMPLRTPDGFVLGTLCTIAHEPHTVTAAQERALTALASQVVSVLELRRTGRMLREQQASLDTFVRFFELAPDLFCTADSTLHFRELNPAWSNVLGWTLAELRARPFISFVHPDDVASTQAEAGRLLRESSITVNFENRYQHRDGHFVRLSWATRVEGGVFYCSAHDLTDRDAREAQLLLRESALAESEGRLRAVFEGMVEGVVLQFSTGEIAASNKAAESILGLTRDQMLGRSSMDPRWRSVHENGDPFPGIDHPAMVTLRTGQPLTDVIMGVHKPSGELRWISINTRPLLRNQSTETYGVVCTFRDVTAERAAAERASRLVRQERLVTTGTLAAGVGHEINNPLSYVIGNLEYSIEEIRSIAGGSPSGRLKELADVLAEARGGAERIRKIVRGLRALGRDDGPPIPTDLRATVEIGVNMAMHELRHRATVISNVPELPAVLADESRLTQVLVNLLVNAGQAFGESDPGRNLVTLSAERTGDAVVLSVADNGPGIAPEVLPRIFDPFFTTKPVGQGTGLGLSISHSILAALGGDLRCETELGKGTTFFVRLPLAAPSDAQASLPPPRELAPRGRVLIVDDDSGVLRTLERALSGEHDVVAEQDPRMALQRLEAGESFDVVFCDLMMPYFTGPAIYRRVKAFDPKLAERFVFITGGVLREDVEAFLAEVPNERFEKPIGIQSLRSTVKRHLKRSWRPSSP